MAGTLGAQGLTFDLRAEKSPLRAWADDDVALGSAAIERDIGGLIKEAAELRSAMANQERDATARLRHVLLAVVEVVDGFEHDLLRAQEDRDSAAPESKSWLVSLRTLYGLLRNVLLEAGVTPMECLEEAFDQCRHRVVGTVADLAQAEGTIVREVAKGYVWQNEVLRRAEVIVVRHSIAEEPPEANEHEAFDGQLNPAD